MLGIFLRGQSLQRISSLRASSIAEKDWEKSPVSLVLQNRLSWCVLQHFCPPMNRNGDRAGILLVYKAAFGGNLFLEWSPQRSRWEKKKNVCHKCKAAPFPPFSPMNKIIWALSVKAGSTDFGWVTCTESRKCLPSESKAFRKTYSAKQHH